VNPKQQSQQQQQQGGQRSTHSNSNSNSRQAGTHGSGNPRRYNTTGASGGGSGDQYQAPRRQHQQQQHSQYQQRQQHHHQHQQHHHQHALVLGPADESPSEGEDYPSDLFFGTSSLFAQLDKKVLVVLQDNKHFVGMFRSFDQFGNFVLEQAAHRVFDGEVFADLPQGLYIIRGENVELLGEIDEEKDGDRIDGGLKRVTPEEFKARQAAAAAATGATANETKS
jgi:U6 snRNA-associated Sm-like protein LSm1